MLSGGSSCACLAASWLQTVQGYLHIAVLATGDSVTDQLKKFGMMFATSVASVSRLGTAHIVGLSCIYEGLINLSMLGALNSNGNSSIHNKLLCNPVRK